MCYAGGMKVVVLYRSKSEHGTAVEQYVREFERRTAKKLELLEIDTREGTALAELYDITQYPAIVATKDDGQLQKIWMGAQLPLIDEVTGYVLER